MGYLIEIFRHKHFIWVLNVGLPNTVILLMHDFFSEYIDADLFELLVLVELGRTLEQVLCD